MSERLVELYEVGEWVQISFGDKAWQRAQVRQLQHPGLWVQTADGRLWFVTNTRHIRKPEKL
ncbi:MAG: hypothetical protein H6661_00775 [Ardenticatenaceae bacterium]|nr:hypothetical protein [Ardenticatenaceae bacterium]